MIKPMFQQLTTIFLVIGIFATTTFTQTKAENGLQTQGITSYPLRINEALIYTALRQIHGAQITYQSTSGNGNYALTLEKLVDLDFIDEVLGSGEKYGYIFSMSATNRSMDNPAFFKITATPGRYPKRGRRSFYLDSSGAVRGADKNGADATIDDPFIVICGGNEGETIQSLHVVLNAQTTYQSITGNVAFGSLSELHKYGLIDYFTSRGESCGYNLTLFTANRTSNLPASFYVTAVPKQYPITGRRSFYIDQSGIIRGADRNGQPATAADPPIEF